MSRYIDADELVRYMEERQERLKDDESLWELSVVETFLGRASSADVAEVVRCKDCIYKERERCGLTRYTVREYDFCNYGVRKENEIDS